MTTTHTPQPPIIVGYDGSEGAQQAVRWAARYASVTGAPLSVVHCSVWALLTDNLDPVEGIKDSGLQHEAERVLTEGVSIAKQIAPLIRITQRLLTGFPAKTLTDLSADASMLVTGTRGLSGFAGLLVGSVSLHLASTATCPVMVVREEQSAYDKILVAVDGSPESDRAVLEAAALARSLKQSLHILHVRSHGDQVDHGPADEARDSVLQQAVDLVSTDPELAVVKEVVVARSTPGEIVERTDAASAVVLGAKGGNTLTTRLGSTVHAVLHHAHGNVLVVG